ncbi:hypothetical protein B566_EDAN007186 [Ephemera danica]|nr:hypothetical protein B566_EDAN007186 [Ephemera danica]
MNYSQYYRTKSKLILCYQRALSLVNKNRFLTTIKMSFDKEWNPINLIDQNNKDTKFSLLILNQPILTEKERMLAIWKRASLRITADGGTDRWLQFLRSCCPDKELVPDIVTGDLDSITPEALAHCSAKGSLILKKPDQDNTDFTKGLIETSKWQEVNKVELDGVIALVETAGRLDQILANLNTLYLAQSILTCPVYQLASDSLTWLLNPGTHKINVPASLAKGYCGLVPLGAPNKDGMKFGDLISTNNLFDNPEGGIVTVTTDTPLIWTMGLY